MTGVFKRQLMTRGCFIRTSPIILTHQKSINPFTISSMFNNNILISISNILTLIIPIIISNISIFIAFTTSNNILISIFSKQLHIFNNITLFIITSIYNFFNNSYKYYNDLLHDSQLFNQQFLCLLTYH